MSTPREYLTVREAAARLGRDRSTVYRLMKARAIPYTRIGGLLRIPWHLLADEADARTVHPRPARGVSALGGYPVAYTGENVRV